MAHERYDYAIQEDLTCQECGWQGTGDGLESRYEDLSFSHEFGTEEQGFFVFTCPDCGTEIER